MIWDDADRVAFTMNPRAAGKEARANIATTRHMLAPLNTDPIASCLILFDVLAEADHAFRVGRSACKVGSLRKCRSHHTQTSVPTH